MTNELIQASVSIIGGGGLVAIFNFIVKSRKAKRESEQEPEQYIRTLFQLQISDLTASIESIRIRLEDLLEANARLEQERTNLQAHNKDLGKRLTRAELLINELTSKLK